MFLKFLKLFFAFLGFSLTVHHSNGQESLKDHDIHEGNAEPIINKEHTFKKPYRIIKFHWNKNLESSLDVFNQLECLDCPPSFGHIISGSPFEQEGNNVHLIKTNHCQGSLIKEDLFLTAHHCLAESLNSPGDSCADNILIILPRLGNNYPARVLKCDHLVSLSNEYENLSKDDFQPDWAIIKLRDKAPRRFLIPDNKGGDNNEYLFGFLPLENLETGEVSITQFQCKVIQNSLNLPGFRSEKSPMAFLECDRYMINGFSGTTLFRRNENDYSPVATFSHLLQEDMNFNGENQSLKASKKIIASHITCMSPADEAPEFCKFYPNRRIRYQQQLVAESLQDLKLKIDRDLAPWTTDESYPVKWQPINLENWENLPKPYSAYFKKILEEIKDRLGVYGTYYVQNLIPLYPECIHQNFIPMGELLPDIQVQIPMIRILVLKDKHIRVVTQYEILKLNAHLVLASKGSTKTELSDDNPKEVKFIINFTSEVSLFQKPKGAIIGHQFSHSPAIIPVCPET